MVNYMRRMLLKLSGEALAGSKKMGFDEETVRKVALQVKELTEDAQIGIVIGGGNFWRGRSSENSGSDRHACNGNELYLCV